MMRPVTAPILPLPTTRSSTDTTDDATAVPQTPPSRSDIEQRERLLLRPIRRHGVQSTVSRVTPSGSVAGAAIGDDEEVVDRRFESVALAVGISASSAPRSFASILTGYCSDNSATRSTNERIR